MTLNQTWKNCLRMWKWIVKQVKKGRTNVENLKEEWLEEHEFTNPLWSDCFFCDYDAQHSSGNDECCSKCPGRLVSKSFNCMESGYDYQDRPEKFYQKLLQLDAKRRIKK